MSNEISLTLQDAQAIVDSLGVAAELKQWGKRSDSERLAIGIVVLSHTMRGKTLRTLEAELGIPYATLHRYKERALMAITSPTIEAARNEELERLDRIIEVQWDRVEAGDPKATEIYLKVSERRSKLLGLDKPTQVEAMVMEVTPQEAELQRLIQQTEAENKAIEQHPVLDADEDFA